jgi:hypothetical protein
MSHYKFLGVDFHSHLQNFKVYAGQPYALFLLCSLVETREVTYMKIYTAIDASAFIDLTHLIATFIARIVRRTNGSLPSQSKMKVSTELIRSSTLVS